MAIYAVIEQRKLGASRSPRRVLRLESDAISSERSVATSVEIRDLSASGFLMHSTAEFEVGEYFDVRIEERPIRASVVWRSGPSFGCEFARHISKASMSAA